MLTIGITGCELMDDVLKDWFEKNSTDTKMVVNDSPAGKNDTISGADACSPQFHVSTEEDDDAHSLVPWLDGRLSCGEKSLLNGVSDFVKVIKRMPLLTLFTQYPKLNVAFCGCQEHV